MSEVLQAIGRLGLVPVVVVDDPEKASDLGQALLDGGLPCAEVTYRTAAAGEVIRRLASGFPEMLVGAGTVLTTKQAEQAVESGARFIVSPGFDPAIVDWCQARQIPVTPGVLTPSEITAALARGLTVLKFFPAEAAGGIRVLKANGGPFKQVKFIPTGGINADNLKDYLELPMVHACGGSWLVDQKLIAAGDFEQILRRTRQAVTIISEVRGERG